MLHARLVGLARRVQRISEQEEAERGHRVLAGADDERAVPAAHRPTPEHELLGRQLRPAGKLAGGFARGGVQHRRPVR